MSTASNGTPTTTFASRATLAREYDVNTQTVKYGTVLQPGDSAVYPSSLYTAVAQSSSSTGGSSLNAGAIAGIVVGSVAGALLIAFLIFLLVVRRRRASKKVKRQSRTHLLPTNAHSNGASPDMVQRNPTSYDTMAPGASAAAIAVPVASHQRKPYNKSGLQFGSGHRRHDSAASTTPFLAGNGDNSRMSLETFNNSPTRDRFSYTTTASMETADSPRFQGQYASERPSIEEEPVIKG